MYDPAFNYEYIDNLLRANSRLIKSICSDGVENYYTVFKIPKRRGKGFRVIESPSDTLKGLQRELAGLLNFSVHNSATGFISGKSILHNAVAHAGCSHVLNVDIKDFYKSITKDMVIQALADSGYDRVDDLSCLLTYNNHLPAGSPASPLLSNAVAYTMDCLLSHLASIHGYTFSRYVDDMTFGSHSFIPIDFIASVQEIVESLGFNLNSCKTRFYSSAKRLIVTGLVINKDVSLYNYAPRIPRCLMRRIRVLAHKYHRNNQSIMDERGVSDVNAIKYNATLKKLGDKKSVLLGYIAWARGINPIQAAKIERWVYGK